MQISFKDIPNMSTKLFLDYLYEPSKTTGFYAGDFRNADDVKRALSAASVKASLNRSALADTLMRQNRYFGNSEQTFRNIELLRNQNSVAIVTGQQMGLFGGPLYTIYKAMGVNHFMQMVRDEFPRVQFGYLNKCAEDMALE